MSLSLATLGPAGACLIAPAKAGAKVFPTCKAVNKVYAHGIAKNFKVVNAANGLTGPPFVSSKLSAANHSRDRDKGRRRVRDVAAGRVDRAALL